MDLYAELGFDTSDPKIRSAIDMERQRRSLMRKLVEIRKSRNLSLKDVASELQISHQAVARIEAGNRDARLSTITRYALAVGAHVNVDVKLLDDAYDNFEPYKAEDGSEGFTVSLTGDSPSDALYDRKQKSSRSAVTGRSIRIPING